MRILGISGTPRKGGNSEILLSAALEPFAEVNWEIKRIMLSEKTVQMCTGCDSCRENQICRINDDMTDIYEAFEWCDALIISSPCYWRNVPAQLKAVFDRTYAKQHIPLKGKLGGAIAVGNSTSGGGQTNVLTAIYNFFLSNGMLCVPGELNGVTASAGEPGSILSQPHRLEQARVLGRNIIRYTFA